MAQSLVVMLALMAGGVGVLLVYGWLLLGEAVYDGDEQPTAHHVFGTATKNG